MTHDTNYTTRSATLAIFGLAAVWLAAAGWHPTTTYHLAPILIVAVGPLMLWSSKGGLLRTTLTGTIVASGSALLLAALDLLRGPSLLPTGGALAESLVFAAGTALVMVVVAAVPNRESVH